MKLFGGRKYPIKRDESGRSARQRACDLFSQGHRPSQVRKLIPISLRTACRYFEDFKKINHRIPYLKIKRWFKDNPEVKERVIDMLAASLEMSREEVMARIRRPWGLLQAMKGEWPNYRVDRQWSEIEQRLLAALEIVRFADKFGGKNPKMVIVTLKGLMGDRGGESSYT